MWIPDYAELTADKDDYHEFSVEQHIDNTVMIDGTLLCRYADDHTIREIVNHLGSYTYYDLVNILSPQQAYEQLKRGKLQDDYFEKRNPAEVQILSCHLKYEMDTKGYYQPVYEFELQYAGEESYSFVKIPAMV